MMHSYHAWCGVVCSCSQASYNEITNKGGLIEWEGSIKSLDWTILEVLERSSKITKLGCSAVYIEVQICKTSAAKMTNCFSICRTHQCAASSKWHAPSFRGDFIHTKVVTRIEIYLRVLISISWCGWNSDRNSGRPVANEWSGSYGMLSKLLAVALLPYALCNDGVGQQAQISVRDVHSKELIVVMGWLISNSGQYQLSNMVI